jgi:glycine/D-amino acid oxidase-like deaminating enzyme
MPRAPLAFETVACLRFRGQAQIHPLRYLQALVRAIEAQGGRLYRGEATRFEDGATGARGDERGPRPDRAARW